MNKCKLHSWRFDAPVVKQPFRGICVNCFTKIEYDLEQSTWNEVSNFKGIQASNELLIRNWYRSLPKNFQ